MFSRALFRKRDFSACSQAPSFDVTPSPGQPENRVSRGRTAQHIDFGDLPTQRPLRDQLDYTRSLGECGPVGRVLTNTGTVYSNPENL